MRKRGKNQKEIRSAATAMPSAKEDKRERAGVIWRGRREL
jgi:hypothetical protein